MIQAGFLDLQTAIQLLLATLQIEGSTVTFQPGARTNWHTHPFGQLLVLTSGSGRVQDEGGFVGSIKKGDVV